MEELNERSQQQEPAGLLGIAALQRRLDTSFSGQSGAALRWIFGLVMAFVIVWSFGVPEVNTFQQPELARIFFWHFPCPILASIMLMQGAWWSFRHLRTGDLKWDVQASVVLEIGFIFCLLTMASGMVFSRVQWGAWWQNDPRQTSFLLVLMIYAAYFVLRAAYHDPVRRGANSAGYALAATLPALFLIFVFPRLPQIAQSSFHPTQSIWSGQIHGSYAQVVIATMLMITGLAMWVYRLKVRAGLLELHAIQRLETRRNGATTARVVRPVRLPPSS